MENKSENKKICKYYQHPKICTGKDVCGEKLVEANAALCCSNLYYSMALEQENKRLLEIINAKPLETVDMDCAFEIEKLKEQLRVKEQECERLRKQYNCNACGTCNGKEDYKNMQRHCEKAIAQNHKYKQELNPFKDPYFKGLDNQIIAGLAKKSIRLTTENRKLENALDEIETILQDALDPEKTDAQESFDNFYKCLDIINKAKDGE